MKRNKFDKEERDFVDSFERDEWHSIPSLEDEIAAYKSFAQAQVERKRQINIRLSKEDWEGIQKKASAVGVPSETLISTIVHQFVKGKLVEQ